MSRLSDYLDLLEPSRPGTVYRPPAITATSTSPPTAGSLAPSSSVPASMTFAPAAMRIPAPRATFTPPSSVSPTGTAPRPGYITPAPSGDEAARADCVTFCQNPANARECIPAAAGGTGFCSWAIPAATASGGGVLTIDPRTGISTGSGSSSGGFLPPAPTKPALWPWAIAAFVAWRLLRR